MSELDNLLGPPPTYPPIEMALRDGHTVRGFISGPFGGATPIRVVRIENNSTSLLGYGEAPTIDEALGHASLDYVLGHESYKDQYLKIGSRHMQWLAGKDEPESEFDAWLMADGKFYARESPEDHLIYVSLRKHFNTMVDKNETIQKQIQETRRPFFMEDRGITYKVSAKTLGGKKTYSTKVVSNPFNKNPFSYIGEKNGRAETFADALTAAFSSDTIELDLEYF